MKQLITIFLLFAVVSVFAQTDTTLIQPNAVELSTVNVTAYRADLRTPVTFKNIDKRDIDKINFGQEPTAILNYTPSVTMTSDAGNAFGYSSFRIRGIDQTRINVTLDGIPLNEPEDQGLYFNNYPDFFNSVSSIQIQRGVGTSTNGVSAYGGSINMTSASPFSERGLETGFGYGSFGTGRLYTELNTGVSENGYGAYVRVSAIGTDGFVDNANHFGRSAFYSVGRQWNDNTLKITGFIGKQNNGMAWLGATQDMLDESETANGNTPDEDDEFTNALTSIQYTKIVGNSRINATAYYNYLNGNYDVDLNNFGIEAQQNIALLHGYYGAFVNVTHYLGDLNLTYGVHGNQFERRHTGTFDIADWNYQNTGFRQTFSAFAKANYEIGKLRLYVDIQERLTDFTYDGSQEMPSQDWAFFNYRGGFNYQINNRYSVYYSYGQTSREPTRNDLFLGNDDLDLSFYPDGEFKTIDPEQVQDHEFGFKFNSGKLAFQANGYFMSFDNEITLLGAVGPNGLQLSGNVDNSYRAGVELDAAYKVSDSFRLIAQATQSENRILQDGVEFNHVLTPSTIVNLGGEYSIKYFTFGLDAKYQGEAYLDLANTEKLDGFALLNVRTTYHADDNISLSLFLNNVTNQTYNASGYVSGEEVRYFRQAGFNVFASIVVRI